MNNRVQQRFDRSIRDAVEEETRQANARKPRRAVRPLPEEPAPVLGRMVLLLDPDTGGTVLVPWGHPLAVARRARQTQSRRSDAPR